MAKKPQIKYKPTSEKKPRLTPIFDREDDTVIFSFQWFDGLNRWCPDGMDHTHDFWEIAEKLKSFELKKWKHIAANQHRDHSIPFSRLVPAAQKAAITKQIDDHDEIWSIHFTGTQRLWGVKSGRHFMVIWWDPHHQVCPSLRN